MNRSFVKSLLTRLHTLLGPDRAAPDEVHQNEVPLNNGTLSEWRQGRDAIVVEVPWADRLSCRLRELGLLPGVRLRVLRTGSRLVIQIGESRLALRRADAVAIRVTAADPIDL